jgi:hypothetical protein
MGNEDIINCISGHNVLEVVDMRHDKMEDRESLHREVKDEHCVAEVGGGGGGATSML